MHPVQLASIKAPQLRGDARAAKSLSSRRRGGKQPRRLESEHRTSVCLSAAVALPTFTPVSLPSVRVCACVRERMIERERGRDEGEKVVRVPQSAQAVLGPHPVDADGHCAPACCSLSLHLPSIKAPLAADQRPRSPQKSRVITDTAVASHSTQHTGVKGFSFITSTLHVRVVHIAVVCAYTNISTIQISVVLLVVPLD